MENKNTVENKGKVIDKSKVENKSNVSDSGKVERLAKLLEQQKLVIIDDLLKIRGSITMLEKRIERERGMASETEGRIVQIEETLKFLKTKDPEGVEK